jgi:hypothetical protein
MSATDHLNGVQFRSVTDLLNTRSRDARNYGEGRLVADVYDRKAKHIAAGMSGRASDWPDYSQLDEHIRSGTIDPVILQRTPDNDDQVIDGNHRIVRAHQLGVGRLPVSYDPGAQVHYDEWDV